MSEDIFRFLDTNGDGTGTKIAIGDYSIISADFYIEPPAGQVFEITRLLVFVEDAAGMRAERYGSMAALTNGIQVLKYRNGSLVVDLTDGLPVTTNGQWARNNYDADMKTWGAGDEVLTVRWTFSKSGKPLRLVGNSDERLVVRLRDDFTGLVDHTFKVDGQPL